MLVCISSADGPYPFDIFTLTGGVRWLADGTEVVLLTTLTDYSVLSQWLIINPCLSHVRVGWNNAGCGRAELC
jgi:hypothetical protein